MKTIESPIGERPSTYRGAVVLSVRRRACGLCIMLSQIPPEEKSMRIATTIARLLLGAVMVFAGANHLFNFLPKSPMPPGLAGQFLGAMIATGYMYAVGVFEVLPGLLLLINRFVPLALAVLGPVIVNIFIVNLLMAPKALPISAVIIILWILAAYRARSAFLPLLQQRVAE
jgi:uncharacterized membrane protein